MEIHGAASGPTVDALAEQLRTSLDAVEDKVSSVNPLNADMRILILDYTATEEEVVTAIVETGECSAE